MKFNLEPQMGLVRFRVKGVSVYYGKNRFNTNYDQETSQKGEDGF